MAVNFFNRYWVVGTLLAIIFGPSFVWMVERWMAPDSYYTHGFLIPFISGFFIWKEREFLRPQIDQAPRFIGSFILIMSVGLQCVSAFWRVYFTQSFALVLMLIGFVFYLYPWSTIRKLSFPVLFLLFLIPLPLDIISSLNLNLKMFAAQVAVSVVKTFGIHCIREGSHIHFLTCSLTVGNVCSGLRSLIALLAFGALFTYITKLSFPKKLFLFVSSFPIAILSNVIRIVVLCVIANFWGAEAATGFYHDLSGILVFIIAYLLLFLLDSILLRLPG